MRIDTKPVESPNITWAECRRERLLLQRLILVSALEICALALVVLVLVALVSLAEGNRDLATRTGTVAVAVAAATVLFEVLFRIAKRRIRDLDQVMNGEQPS